MASLEANLPDEETQKLRYAALKGKKVLILSATYMVAASVTDVSEWTKWFINWVRENGAEIGFASPKNYEPDALGKIYREQNLYDKLIEVDDMQSEAAAKSIADACRRENWQPDGVYSHVENLQPLIGAVCEELGIHNNPHKAYQIARNKFLARKVLGEAGLATTKAVEVFSLDDVDKAIEVVGFPMVVKPTSGAGSQGVYRADSPEEVRQLVARVLEDMQTQVNLVYNPGVGENQAPVFCETCMIPKVFEGYPVGEFDCDLLIWNKKLVYADVVDNWKPQPPYYMENGANFPTVVPDEVRQELIDYAYKCVIAMGFFQGAIHVECMYTEKDGAILIEVNPRAGGGPSREFHLDVRGVDFFINFFLAHMNIPINPPQTPPKIAATGYDFCAPKTGKMDACDFLDGVKDHEWVAKTIYYKSPGDKVVGLDTGVPDWVAHLRLEAPADKIREAVQLTEKLANEAIPHIKISPVSQPPRRRSSHRPSLLDDIESLNITN